MIWLLLLGLIGNAHTKPLPPLPWDNVQSKGDVPGVAVVLAPLQGRIVIRWENQDVPWASNYISRVETTADLASWSEVARLPYKPADSFTITNGPPFAFYRIVNSIKP